MNYKTDDVARALGPCPEHEFEIAELAEGSLDATREPGVLAHLQDCARCGAYFDALAAIDAGLAAALAPPEPSPGFDARLHARIHELTRAPDRRDALAAARHEYQEMLARIGHRFTWQAALNAASLASVVGGLVVAGSSLAPGVLRSFGLDGPAMSSTLAYSVALGAAVAVAGMWYSRRPASTLFIA